MKKSSIVIAFVVILLEIFIFNFPTIKSIFYNKTLINKTDLILHDINYSELDNKYYISSKENYIEFIVNQDVKNLYLNIYGLDLKPLKITFDYTDDANQYYYKFNSHDDVERYIVKDIEKSKYIDVHHLGNTTSIKLKLDFAVASQFRIDEISINKIVPLFFNWTRVIGLFFLIFIPYQYFYNSKVKEWLKNKKNQNIVLGVTILLFSIFTIFLYKNVGYMPKEALHDYYGLDYVDSIVSGKLSLDVDYDAKKLDRLENIYDFSERVEEGINIPWDSSYYNNNFYMYFGIFPALIMAFFRLFNLTLSTFTLSCVFSVISCIFGSLLIKEIIEKFFPKTSFGLKILMIIFFLFNSRLLLLIPKTTFYELIVLSGFCMSIVGIYLFFLFEKTNKTRYLLLGSIFLACVALCRPLMLLVSFLGIYVIYKKLNKKNILFLIIPYVIIGLITMYINYIRFDNIFDFGIQYQLGILDNSYPKFNTSLVLNGIFTYLFRMPIIGTTFPYIFNNISMFEYFGFYYNILTGNGIITMSILGLILPFVYKKTDKKVLKFIFVCLFLGMILLILDNSFGGAIKRYSLEFSWLFLIPIILLTINCLKHKEKALLFIVLISCILNFLVIFDLENDKVAVVDEYPLHYELMYF